MRYITSVCSARSYSSTNWNPCLIGMSFTQEKTYSLFLCSKKNRSFLLNVPYEKCHERMKTRGFANENLLPLEYFRQIEEAHTNIFGNLNEHG